MVILYVFAYDITICIKIIKIMYIIISDFFQQAVVDPLVGGAVIGGIGSLLGGLFGSKSQKSANSANLQIARETNKLNRDLFYANQSWQEEMWNKQNAYNDPSAQAQRLSAAGFNPYLSDTDAGTASSMPSMSAPTMQGATMQSSADIWSNTFNNIARQVGDYYYQSELQKQEIEQKRQETKNIIIRNQYDAASLIDRLSETAGRAREFHSRANLQELEKYYLQDTFTTRVKQVKAELQQTMIKNYGEHLQNMIFEVTHKYLEPQKVAELLQAAANINLTKANTKLVFANILKASLEAEGIRLNNKQLRETMDYLINIKRVESANMSSYGTMEMPHGEISSIGSALEHYDAKYFKGLFGKGAKWLGDKVNNFIGW